MIDAGARPDPIPVSGFTKLDPWVMDLLVDPIGKTPLSRQMDELVSDYGRRYPLRSGVPDLRPLAFRRFSLQGAVWGEGQRHYEDWQQALSARQTVDYAAELEGVREVYDAIPIRGRCLDVGGHQGRLRAFLAQDQEYLVVDPYLDVFDGIERQRKLLATYPFLMQPVNFVCGVAEHLPLRACTFETVHMRSVLDHFESPELALLEAFRVLHTGGQLIVGLWVDGGRTGKPNLRERVKHAAKDLLPIVGLRRFADHHVWHPTYPELIELTQACGFQVDHVHWQSQWKDNVCYVRAVKR